MRQEQRSSRQVLLVLEGYAKGMMINMGSFCDFGGIRACHITFKSMF